MTSLLILLGVVLSSLTVYAEIKPSDYHKLEGKWYEIGLSSDSSTFIGLKKKHKMGRVTLKPTKDEGFDLFYERLENNAACRKLDYIAQKTNVAGVFKSDKKYKIYDITLTVKKTNFNEYLILKFHLETVGKIFNVINYALYARSPKPSDEVKKMWKSFVKDKKIKDDNIIFFSENGECKAA